MSCLVDDLFIYRPGFLSAAESAELFRALHEQALWQSDYAAFGRRISLPRCQAWYAEACVRSRYSARNLLSRQDIPEAVMAAKFRVEADCRKTFNSVLVTLYRDGHDHVGYHADDEAELGIAPVIASLSLGGTRRFWLRPKQQDSTRPTAALSLHAGDLVIMLPSLQQQWEHAVLPEPDCREARMNLTFRAVN
jgi:alkylated DNA repair dioxygenase AlkB